MAERLLARGAPEGAASVPAITPLPDSSTDLLSILTAPVVVNMCGEVCRSNFADTVFRQINKEKQCKFNPI
jgi:hypothetical protein